VVTFPRADGRILSYRDRGSGPPIVLLPGGPGLDPETYFASTDLLGFCQILFCPRGTGESDPPANPDGYRMAANVDDVEDLRRHLDLDRLRLCGSSHGASIALAYASAYPDRVERMVLTAGPARMDGYFAQAVAAARERFRAAASDGDERLNAGDAAFALLRTATSDDVRRAALKTMMSRYVARLGAEEAEFLSQLSAAPMNFTAAGPMGAEMASGLNLLARASAIVAPTLVLAGELDVNVPAEHMREVAAAVSGARLVQLAGVGHFSHVEAHDQWIQLVGDFFRSKG